MIVTADNDALFIRPDKVLTLCQLLMGRMGLEPILPIKVPITTGVMLNLNRAELKIN